MMEMDEGDVIRTYTPPLYDDGVCVLREGRIVPWNGEVTSAFYRFRTMTVQEVIEKYGVDPVHARPE